jgi:hypothetical protein
LYRTRHFPADLDTPSGGAFVRRGLAYYGARAAKRRLQALLKPGSDRWRDAEAVRDAYDAERGYTLEREAALSFDELVYGSADRFDTVPESDFILLDDAVVWGPTRTSRRFLVEEIEQQVRRLTSPGSTVIELGSGSGRNLLHLRKCLPDRRFVGLELSPVSVKLARHLSDKFQLPVEFVEANVCQDLAADVPRAADLVYSSHALEMMPRQFVGAVRNALTLSQAHVLFFEPIPELWPTDARGLTSHLRAYVMDRLDGFMPVLHRELAARPGWTVVNAERLRTSTNPVNETCRVLVTRKNQAG